MKRILLVIITAVALCSCAACKKQADVQNLVDKVWAYSQTHPDGFTIHIPDFSEPDYGIAVSYAATQDSHSKASLPMVISHAQEHDGYVGGWLDADSGLYYFDSTRLFPEDERDEAIAFGKANGQISAYVISTGESIDLTRN
ncbi:MAG: hypothetical protein Q4B16_07180 [Bacteroidia bacterium]|nr:hypothetical protein [Bacteroidia bacterium]